MKWVDRGLKQTLIVVPGWAMDSAFFTDSFPEYNLLIVNRCSYSIQKSTLLSCISTQHIIGICIFSMGLQWVKKVIPEWFRYPLFLISTSTMYDKKTVCFLLDNLKKQFVPTLTSFYRQCCSQKETWKWFKTHWLEHYLNSQDQEQLIQELTFLYEESITDHDLGSSSQLTAIMSTNDKIVNLHPTELVQFHSDGHIYEHPFGHIFPLHSCYDTIKNRLELQAI